MLKRSMVLLLSLILAVMLSGAAFAQPEGAKGAKGPKGAKGAKGGPGWNMLKGDDENGDAKISPDEFSGPPSNFPKFDKNGDGFITEAEVGPGRKDTRVDKGPKAGTVAPTFVLKSLDGKEEFDLESFRGKKPVVLFFGSYT